MLLGEYIHSIGIDYSDCKHFQIVCPACKEPVFKVFRATPAPGIHYLSHYEKDRAYEAECELRVSRIKAEEIESRNAASRGQRLEYFLGVLRQALSWVITRPDEGGADALKLVKAILASAGPQMLRDQALRWFIDRSRDLQDFERFLDAPREYWSARTDGPIWTGFAIATQRRIVKDICLHLLSPNAQGNFSFLWATAYASFLNSLTKCDFSRNRELKTWEEIRDLLRALVGASREKAMVIMREAKKQCYASRGIDGDLLSVSAHHVTSEMRLLLWRLPYLALLKMSRRGWV
jgi:hypothetical protein